MPLTPLGIVYDHNPGHSDSRYAVYAAPGRRLTAEAIGAIVITKGDPVANIAAIKAFILVSVMAHVGQCEQGVAWKWSKGKDKGNENQQSDKLDLNFTDKNATVANELAAMQIASADLDILYLDELNLEARFYLCVPNSLERSGKGGEKKKLDYHLELDTQKPEIVEYVLSLA